VTVDVVIPTYNASELVLGCIARLVSGDGDQRIIVVDDASTDGTADAVRAAHPDVTIVRLEEQRGLAYAFNRGAEAGDGELVLFLNNDTFADRRAVAALAEALERDPAAASAGGRLVDPGTQITQTSYQPRAIPGLAGLVVRLVGVERAWPGNPWTGRHLTAPLDSVRTQRTARQPAGACLMVRRSALDRVRGWDERYWIWYEDVDLSRRLAAIGPALYVPSAVFEHVGAASTGSWRKHEQHLRLYHGTMVYAQAHLPRPQQLAVALTMVAVCLPRVLLGRPRAVRPYLALLSRAIRMMRFEPVRP
jgi:N-acetylglucosaminyl-diphospho-decaprenol L-rhamnosyltransferase